MDTSSYLKNKNKNKDGGMLVKPNPLQANQKTFYNHEFSYNTCKNKKRLLYERLLS